MSMARGRFAVHGPWQLTFYDPWPLMSMACGRFTVHGPWQLTFYGPWPLTFHGPWPLTFHDPRPMVYQSAHIGRKSELLRTLTHYRDIRRECPLTQV